PRGRSQQLCLHGSPSMTPRPVAVGTPTLEKLPTWRYAVTMLTSVAVVLLENVAPFELGVLCEVFGTDRSADGSPLYDFRRCSIDAKPVRTRPGFTITPTHDLAALETADLVAVP